MTQTANTPHGAQGAPGVAVNCCVASCTRQLLWQIPQKLRAKGKGSFCILVSLLCWTMIAKELVKFLSLLWLPGSSEVHFMSISAVSANPDFSPTLLNLLSFYRSLCLRPMLSLCFSIHVPDSFVHDKIPQSFSQECRVQMLWFLKSSLSHPVEEQVSSHMSFHPHTDVPFLSLDTPASYCLPHKKPLCSWVSALRSQAGCLWTAPVTWHPGPFHQE